MFLYRQCDKIKYSETLLLKFYSVKSFSKHTHLTKFKYLKNFVRVMFIEDPYTCVTYLFLFFDRCLSSGYPSEPGWYCKSRSWSRCRTIKGTLRFSLKLVKTHTTKRGYR